MDADKIDAGRRSLLERAHQYLSHEDRVVRELATFVSSAADVALYDVEAVLDAREQLRNYQRMLWAIVDTATRSGTPVRVSLAAIAAYDTSSKLLIETNDVATSELLLWTDSPRGN